ncbi:TauD/TfdA family dioxygenase [Streptomyces gardneri]|jgi:alpha-ketoglutarate-dependent taurine dioxygenase|uniref:TauD/TfdA dioxygenase family protein n=1 Tax=Nocardia TaxID=1817 RepID=UPI001356D931|nr:MULTISPECIES: TauD/TfdA family dioxygenase [Nocardia]MBF6166206.1 TauD/TfdA family dioxygenase [Streptomyces gardneri]MBF6205629.1 TauD/TfdA family dioxygenase [Streptomyces gardneri]
MTKSSSELLLGGQRLRPFGRLVASATEGQTLADVPIEELLATTLSEKVVVLRGFGLLGKPELENYCRAAGEILQWNFGSILDLVVRDTPDNYLFDRDDVPFHWDGAFAEHVPRFFLFQCVRGEGAGGETVFCDSVQVYREAPEDLKELWARTTITYRTDKLAHYGGSAEWPLLGTHPVTGETTIRYAEPLDPARYANPLFLTVEGISAEDGVRVMEDLRERLHDARYCYAHQWRTGDIVVVENHALLHGRNAFTGSVSRHLQRIQII